MKFTLLLTSVISALSLLPGTRAWGQEGHEIVATIAEVYLEPGVLPTLCSILHINSCSLASVSTWADQIRNKMKWSAPLHFVNPVADHPPQICPFPGTKGWEGAKGANVLGAIRNTTDVLARWVQEGSNPADPVANEALRFLIHFAGDVHMPFHLVGRARGGNDVYVKWGGKKVKLHGLWDTNLVQRAIQNTPPKWATPLSSDIEKHLHGAKYDPLIRKTIIGGINGTWATSSKSWVQCPAISPFPSSRGDDQTVLESVWDPSETDGAFVCPWRWSAPIHQMACDWAWPKELDKPPYDAPNGPLLEMDTDQYAGKVAKEWVVEKLLAMAGIRLALILNLIFAPS